MSLHALPADYRSVTPENLDSYLSRVADLEELKIFLDNIQRLENAGATLAERNYYMGLRSRAADLYGQWQANQINFAVQYETNLGWYSNPLLVPAANYTGRSNDPTEYKQRLIAAYGGLYDQDRVSRNPYAAEQKAKEDAAIAARAAAAAAAAKAAAEQAAAAAAAKAAEAAAKANSAPTQQNITAAVNAASVAQNADVQLTHATNVATSTQLTADSLGAEPYDSKKSLLTALGLLATAWSFFK